MQEILQIFLDNLMPWLLFHGLKILAILIGAFLIRRFARVVIEKIIRKAIVANNFLSPEAEKKREDTLISVFEGTFRAIIWIVAALMIIAELGVNIGPLLAGAGVIGLAIGFGAQYIIRDFFTGLFIILENQYRVGDVVCIKDICGEVENINLRMTILRDVDGAVHHIPNGEIKIATNKTKGFARVNLVIGVAYDADLEKVKQVINQVGQDMIKDSEWKDKIIKAPEFIRVENFSASSVDIKISGEVKPLEQWAILGELRKRIKLAFDKQGIEIPFPQRVVRQLKD
ncbi:MAG: mechanosensitive ion channel family protein [Candidatus Portnoybacteria bacterium]|nr:mechanosensitive ion channel family protein [Candidatus Portnoybacteria bacterium]